MNEISNNVNDVITATANEVLVEETPKYSIYKNLQTGQFEKRMKYDKFWSFVPETDEDVEKFFMIFNDQDNEFVVPMKEIVGLVFTIKNVYFNPYDSFDKETGKSDSGVTTTLETDTGEFYATSSKAVYYTLQNMFDVFGLPNSQNYKPLTVTVTSKKLENGYQINLKLAKK